MQLRLVFLFLAASVLAHAGQLVSGPMLGHRAHREVFLWTEVKGAESVALDYWIAGQPETKQTIALVDLPATPAGGQIAQFRPGLLEMGATYDYALRIDGEPQTFPFPTQFKTTDQWEWRRPAPDFKFLFGTCAYFNDPPYDRPGEGYGKTMETFRLMGESGADFMIWGGDNWYYREADFSSVSGLWYRAQRDRAHPELRQLFATMHHYATWDDHDYGSNDANKSFEFKGEALDIFKAYWGNPGYGEPDNAGVYTKFFWGDAAFIVMDNRYHRDDTELDQTLRPDKSQYGARQLEWLKQSLLQVKVLLHYRFIFIVTGGQVLTSFGGASETFDYFRRERAEILKFIEEHKIPGVIFLSGDVHFTELARAQLPNGQAIYELTSSPLTSGTS
ncbi:MAG: phosphodiesterase, partial [Opitutus sp.]|nr:phosphodiesterase [Opitutus sp.]